MVEGAAQPLAGKTVAVPEMRELDVFARMLEARGAATIRCPMVAIHDHPDAASVEAWLRRFNEGGCDDLILLTGEGLRRLLGFARRAGIDGAFVARLGSVRKITRGPKPARALREIGLNPDLSAEVPTTDGVIAVLSRLALAERRIGVQLYPDNPNLRLTDFITQAGASADPVLPYVYASAAEEDRVVSLIEQLAAGGVDAIAFTSTPQLRRLEQVAEARGKAAALRDGLARTLVAAVGPVVTAELRRLGIAPAATPKDSYFMKPLVNALCEAFAARAARR